MNLYLLTNKPEFVLYYEHRKSIEMNIALSSPRKAYEYSCDVLKGRFKAGEEIIANDEEFSYYYAVYVIKGRFEAGEKAIANDAYYSYEYAKNVLKGRFELGEPAILSSDYKKEYESFLH
jgi:hypothetical protein